MKGIIEWFKPKAKMKRWMLLTLIGIVLVCYSIAQILVLTEISFQTVGVVILTFVLGFSSTILGLVSINKRTLEIMVESTDDRMKNKKNINLNSLIFDKTVYNQGPNIVVIGGGTGLNTVVSGLKEYTDNITAIVEMSEYGKVPSDSRRELGVLPLEDVKDSLIALSSADSQMSKLFNHKFATGKLRGYNFSDIYFAAMRDIHGKLEDSIIKSNEILNVIGKVIPVTLEEMTIVAELANGYTVEEKARIPEVVTDKLTKINRIYLNPSNCKVTPGVVEAIKNADAIIIGPGSLYTNVIPNLLVNGVVKAIKESAAIKVYINNIMTESGQTDDYTVSDHLNAIIEHCGSGIIDYCIYDTGEVVPEFVKKYNLEGQDLVDQDIDKIKGIKFLQRNLSVVVNDAVRHDSGLVAASVIELICDDLKYQDKQNDPQYMMLNSKLSAEKQIHKIKKNMAKKEKRKEKGKLDNTKKGRSKFISKYSERIDSIKKADEKAKRKQGNKNVKNTKIDKKQNKINNEAAKPEKPQRPKSARGKRTHEEIREDMMKKLDGLK